MRKLFLLGGGELRSFETIDLDNYIVEQTALTFPEITKIYSLFIPLASHDSKPYFNTFRKVYQSKLKTKTDVAIIARGEMTKEHIIDKIDKSQLIYFGGGNTRYLLNKLEEFNLKNEFINAYNKGVICSGLSAGMNMWYDKFFSDADIMEGISNEYVIINGLGIIKGMICPHYNTERGKEYDKYILNNYDSNQLYLGVEDNAGVYYENEELKYSFGKGNAYYIKVVDGQLTKIAVDKIAIDKYIEL